MTQADKVMPLANSVAETPTAIYICDACNYIYDEKAGDPDSGLAPGTRFEDIPDDWMCPVCGVTKLDFRLLKSGDAVCAKTESASTSGKSVSVSRNIGHAASEPGVVIVGAGHAGWSIARELREHGYAGSITMISACDAIPYQKPHLSVAQSKGGLPAQWNAGQRDTLAEQLQVRVWPQTWVITALPAQRRLMTTRGTLRYDELIIATGAQARKAAFAGTGNSRLLSLNDLDDYRHIQTAIDTAHLTAQHEGRKPRIAIIGAGLVGCELANDFAANGHDVTLLDLQALPLQSRIGSDEAQALCASLGKIGVRWVGGASLHRVDALEPLNADSRRVQLEWTTGAQADHETFDLAIACLGVIPRTRLAKASNWTCDDKGLRVDARTLELDTHVYALGDGISIDGMTSGTLAPLMAQARCIAARICGESSTYASPPARWILKTPCHPLTFGSAT